MYKALKIYGNDIETDLNATGLQKYLKAGTELYNSFKNSIEDNLNNFRNADGSLNGEKLTQEWFPLIKADVFISHSHRDLKTALLIAGVLYEEQDIISFIDSCIWGYADDLLRAIDDEFCLKPSGSYSYEKRNYSTSHVHMMLSIALTKMIYNTECLLFLNTPNSIYPKDTIPGKKKEDETLSPWIHTEIEMTKLVKIRNAEEHRSIIKSHSVLDEAISIRHSADTSNMETLTYKQLYSWISKDYKDKFDALNNLYTINKRSSNVVYGAMRR